MKFSLLHLLLLVVLIAACVDWWVDHSRLAAEKAAFDQQRLEAWERFNRRGEVIASLQRELRSLDFERIVLRARLESAISRGAESRQIKMMQSQLSKADRQIQAITKGLQELLNGPE